MYCRYDYMVYKKDDHNLFTNDWAFYTIIVGSYDKEYLVVLIRQSISDEGTWELLPTN